MSAYVVEKAHIHTMIAAGMLDPNDPFVLKLPGRSKPEVWQPLGHDNANVVGAALWRANHRSVNWRYSEQEQQPEYLFNPDAVRLMREHPWRLQIALKALACYEYQSCEPPSWPTSWALWYCNALRKFLCGRGLEGPDDLPGWSISSLTQLRPKTPAAV